MITYRTATLVRGLAFPEGPRWHGGRLWFTDQHARTVNAVDEAGRLQRVAETEDLPGGLAWLPDGSMLVVFMTQRRLMRFDRGEFGEYVDLSRLAAFHCNDMVADARGRVYAGNFGYDLHGGDPPRETEIILVDTDAGAEVFAGQVIFPNGSIITPDGRTLLVAETFAHRIAAFGLDDRGRMTSRRIWAELGTATPDGICLDAEGALWIASPGSGELLRVAQGGAVLARCETIGTPYACMLGGADRRTLFVCTAETDDPKQALALASGRIEQVRVETPGDGLP